MPKIDRFITEWNMYLLHVIVTSAILIVLYNFSHIPELDNAWGQVLVSGYVCGTGLAVNAAFGVAQRNRPNFPELVAWPFIYVVIVAAATMYSILICDSRDLFSAYLMHSSVVLVAAFPAVALWAMPEKKAAEQPAEVAQPESDKPKFRFQIQISDAVMADYEAISLYHGIDLSKAAGLMHNHGMWVMRNINKDTKIAVIDRTTGEVIEERDSFE